MVAERAAMTQLRRKAGTAFASGAGSLETAAADGDCGASVSETGFFCFFFFFSFVVVFRAVRDTFDCL